MKGRIRKIVALAIIMLSAAELSAQKFGIATNAVSWTDLGTLNIELSCTPHRKWSIHAGAEYNPWNFRKPDGKSFRNRHLETDLGVRHWFWFSNSGWFTGVYTHWEAYSRGGIFSDRSEDGNAYGIGLQGGYSLLLSKHWNLEFGIGTVLGKKRYTRYSCTDCGRIEKKGSSFHIAPDKILIQIVYIF